MEEEQRESVELTSWAAAAAAHQCDRGGSHSAEGSGETSALYHDTNQHLNILDGYQNVCTVEVQTLELMGLMVHIYIWVIYTYT